MSKSFKFKPQQKKAVKITKMHVYGDLDNAEKKTKNKNLEFIREREGGSLKCNSRNQVKGCTVSGLGDITMGHH